MKILLRKSYQERNIGIYFELQMPAKVEEREFFVKSGYDRTDDSGYAERKTPPPILII